MHPAAVLAQIIGGLLLLSLCGAGIVLGEARRSPKRPLDAFPSAPPRHPASKDLRDKMEIYRLKTKEMFYHGFNSYMKFAYPKDELMPVTGSGFDTLGNFSLTLVDALDTLMVMGDANTFITSIPLLSVIDFNIDVNVSVFETNIRVLGALLSCHIMAAMDPEISPYYDWSLLDRAVDLGDRLLLAFDTPTGLPYGSINLMHGVHPRESKDVCTACAGTFSLEFTWLSLLTDDPKYEIAARNAVRAIWKHRSKIDLVGNHINVDTGSWVYKECSIGGLVDSYYEYLLKSSIAFADEVEYGEMFWRVYRAVKIYMKRGDWHIEVSYDTGNYMTPFYSSLAAFWPGLKVLAGDVMEAVEELNAISQILKELPFIPEAINLQQYSFVEGKAGYVLRPEFIESLWVAYQATRDSNILELAFEYVDRLNNLTRTEFGFANIADIRTSQLQDKMESFFLAETLKYLYLLFDPENDYNSEQYVFSTEAHPFPVWNTHRTTIHPERKPEDLAHLRARPLPGVPFLSEIPKTILGMVGVSISSSTATEYKGDKFDRVTTGFKKGVCWVSDWGAALEKTVDRWKA